MRWLISAGYRESEGALVLENFAPVEAEGGSLTPERWRELVECAAAYVRWSGTGSFRDARIDLTLVVPPFADRRLATLFERGIETLVAQRPALTQTLADGLAAHEQAWLRDFHLELAVTDYLQLEFPAPLGDRPDWLERYRRGDSPEPDLAALRLLSDVTWAEVAPLDLRPGVLVPEPDAEVKRISPALLFEASTMLDLFDGLEQHLWAIDEELRRADQLAVADRRSHQVVLATSRLAAVGLACGFGRSLNLLIELDDPPSVPDRTMARFPRVRLQSLKALGRTLPAAFATVTSEPEVVDRSLRTTWSEVTLGIHVAGFAREPGVLGLLAQAAAPAIGRFKASAAEVAP